MEKRNLQRDPITEESEVRALKFEGDRYDSHEACVIIKDTDKLFTDGVKWVILLLPKLKFLLYVEQYLLRTPSTTNKGSSRLDRDVFDEIREVDPHESISTLREEIEFTQKTIALLQESITLLHERDIAHKEEIAGLKETVLKRDYEAMALKMSHGSEFGEMGEDAIECSECHKHKPLRCFRTTEPQTTKRGVKKTYVRIRESCHACRSRIIRENKKRKLIHSDVESTINS